MTPPLEGAGGGAAIPTIPTMNPVYGPLFMDKYNGKDTVQIDTWLNLLEIVVVGLSDADKFRVLLRYLSEDALMFYGTDIAPRIATLTWGQCKASLIARFGVTIIDPLIESQNRWFLRTETVQTYYNDKMRLLRLANISDHAMVAQLTERMPMHYRPHLKAGQLPTPVAWLSLALQLEIDFRHPPRPRIPARPAVFTAQEDEGHRQATALARAATRRPERPDNGRRPPTPCRICQRLFNRDNYHWHNDCPNKTEPHGRNVPPRRTTFPKRVNFADTSELDSSHEEIHLN